MNNRKLFFGIVTIALFSGSSVFAQEIIAPKNVTFAVTIGQLTCKDGVGSAVVKLENTPTEGGYYEVMGEMITKNNISLSREVPLPSGKYFWNGMLNDGYSTTTVSSGTFTIKECSKTTPVTAVQTITEEEKPIIPTTVNNTTTTKTETKATTTSVDVTKEKTTPSRNISLILLVAVVVIGFVIKNQYSKKNSS
jgi:hypothetical protein